MEIRSKNLLWMTFIILLVFSLTYTTSASSTTLSVDPPTSTAAPGSTFTVNIIVTDVFNLYTWEFGMSFDPSVLNVTSVMEGPFLSDIALTSWAFFPPQIDNLAGTINVSNAFFPPFPDVGAVGTGTLCNITFLVIGVGETSLHFDPTILLTFDGTAMIPIDHTSQDGYFSNAVSDVAVVSVLPAKTAAFSTLSVLDVSVTVKNKGSNPETFDVKVYYENVTAAYEIGTQTVTDLAGGAEETLTFGWTLAGVGWCFYDISAEAVLGGDINPADNTLLDGVVHIMVPGDGDGSGVVNLDDFLIWVANFGKHEGEWPPDVYPDYDSSGVVNLDDFLVWVTHFGKSECT